MNLIAKLILETGGFVGPADRAISPLQRVKRELAAVAREADKVAGRRSGGNGPLGLPAPAVIPALMGGASTAAAAGAGLALVRRNLRETASEMRLALAPARSLREELQALTLAGRGGGGGGRRIINVTPFAEMRSELALVSRDLIQVAAMRRLALGNGPEEGGGSRMVYAPIGRLLGNRGVVQGAAGAAGAAGMGLPVSAMAKLGIAGGIVGGAYSATKAASEMEDYETSFATLLGSMDAAQLRMRELARFAEQTPFELPEVAAASRVLETLTNGALSTGQGLRMVGDVAANVKQPVAELAMWIGRTYDGLQSGRPVGEALMRLQELGIMSGEVRTRIEQLQEQGKRGDEVWSVAASSFSRFAGEMDRRSATLSGRVSNLRDSFAGLMRELGGPLVAVANKPLQFGSRVADDFAAFAAFVKGFWTDQLLDMTGGVPSWRMPSAPPATPRAGPRKRASEQEISAAFDSFFGPLDRLGDARASLKDSLDRFRDLRLRGELDNPFSSNLQREAALKSEATRLYRASGMPLASAGPGVVAVPGVEESLRRLDAEVQILEAQKKYPELAVLAAQKLEKLVPIYEQLIGLASQLRNLRADKMDAALTGFFGELDATSTTMGNGRRPSILPNDAMARAGLFISPGGPANDHARRTANATERIASIVERNRAIDDGIRRRNAAVDEGLTRRGNLWD